MNIPYMDPMGKDKHPSELYPMSHKLSSKKAGLSRQNLPTQSENFRLIQYHQIDSDWNCPNNPN